MQTAFESGGFTYIWGCHVGADGHRLAVDFQGRYVVEFDERGIECWRKTVPGQPTSVERQPNGRTLLALAEPGLVVELDRTGDVVWKLEMQGRPTTAQRLENGNILICLQFGRRVVEVDPKGTEIWQINNLHNPFTAQGLENGNVLVCEYADGGQQGGAREFDRAGKVVWSNTGKINNPAQAQRLPSGNTLLSGDNGIMEFDAQNQLVRHIPVSRGRFFAY
jgi:hypothetical protein